MINSGWGATRAENAQGTPTQSHVSPNIQVYTDSISPAAGPPQAPSTAPALGVRV